MSVAAVLRLTLLASMVMLCGAAGCVGESGRVEGYDCSELAKTFFRKPIKVGMEEFIDFEVRKQYAVYICGNQFIHPPAIHLAEVFARSGGEAAGFLTRKLSEANDEITIRDIILVFAEMSSQKTYDVAGDEELMSLMKEKVGTMTDSFLRQLSERDLEEIRKR